MAFSFKKWMKNMVVLANVLVALLLLVACIQSYLSPETYWFLGYLSIAFPYIVLVLCAFAFFWISFSRRLALISLVSIVLAWPQISLLFSWQLKPFSLQKPEGSLRVLTWNVMGFAGSKVKKKEQKANADSLLQTVARYNPDVICFQEYGQFEGRNLGRIYQDDMDKIGYKYRVFSRDYSRKRFSYSSGVAIFSKHPLIQPERITYTSSGESLLQAYMVAGSDTFRVFNTHLQSYRFSKEELDEIEKLKDTEKPDYENSTSLLGKMKRAFRNRGAQVDQAKPVFDEAGYPEIICLDMNDVPNSYAYRHVRGNRKDAFLEKGMGIGRTYSRLFPTLRIDYVFVSPQLEVLQVDIPNVPYSDHYPVVADVRLPK
ncbi:MAG: endonuclease/exonuclease/phosphatase family protein [Chitinophagaceae bacterium]|nr:endonuclease/exonuclease/phosphatase family protein [Chitinophagaceae bacterium]